MPEPVPSIRESAASANISRLFDDEQGVGRALDRGSEQELVRRAQGGDRDAFGELYRTHQPGVFRLARFHLGAGAEDAAAEAFVRAWQSLPRYQDRGLPFAAWLYGIARHVVVDTLRRQGRVDVRAEVPDRGIELMTDELLDLRDAVQRLPEDQRRVIEFKFLLGLTNDEVASVMGTSPGAVNAKQWRALKRLAGELGEVP